MTYSVLVVDDEECIRELCEDVLPMWDYEVETAENGLEGVDKAKRGNYQIILTDIKMPGCDGLTLLEKVKNHNPQIEVIVMTAYGSIETAVEAMKKGAHDFIMKPLSLSQMQVALNKCVEKIELAEKNRELTEVNKKLLELNEMKEKFMAITSHELRTPVCSITGFLELLKYSLTGLIEDDPMSLVGDLEVIVKGLSEIVGDMYELASADRRGISVEKKPFNLVNTMYEVKNEILPDIRKREHELNLKCGKNEVIYLGDRRRIKQLLRELVKNAVKFTRDKGKIDIKLLEEKEMLKITVKDNGIGIGEDKISNIFERFYEVQDLTRHSTSGSAFMGGGIGIGLSLVKEIVLAHGGKISVVSKLEEGSEFIIELPVE